MERPPGMLLHLQLGAALVRLGQFRVILVLDYSQTGR